MQTEVKKAGRPLIILLVEDNIGDATLVLRAAKGFKTSNHVVVLNNGQDALDFLKGKGGYSKSPGTKPDLILLDLNLPVMDGREVLKEIKEDPDLSGIPVIVLTGSSSPMDIQYCYESKANFYFVKAGDLDHFLASMHYLEDIWMKTLFQPEPLAETVPA